MLSQTAKTTIQTEIAPANENIKTANIDDLITFSTISSTLKFDTTHTNGLVELISNHIANSNTSVNDLDTKILNLDAHSKNILTETLIKILGKGNSVLFGNNTIALKDTTKFNELRSRCFAHVVNHSEKLPRSGDEIPKY